MLSSAKTNYFVKHSVSGKAWYSMMWEARDLQKMCNEINAIAEMVKHGKTWVREAWYSTWKSGVFPMG